MDLPRSASVPSAPSTAASPGTVCVALPGRTVEELLAHAAALSSEFPFAELRLDGLDRPEDALPVLRRYREDHPQRTFLVTCRPERSGGWLKGSARAEFGILLAAAKAGFSLVDLSLESAEELGVEAVRRLQSAGARVLISFHDFQDFQDLQETGDLHAVFARMRLLQPDLCKVVPTAQTLDDALDVLRFLRAHAGDASATSLVAVAMGEAGVLTRILGPRSGSAFTFAAINDVAATAPGQLTARTLADLYRIDELTPNTRLFGVAGDPIRTSLSPLMFNGVFKAEAIDATYLPLLTRRAETLFRAARELPLNGFSVTMPLKQTVASGLHHVDPLAARIGAVNTVHRTPAGEFHGYNTDAAGIVAPLERRLSLRGARVLVLGAGGAARAAVFGCADQGARVFIANRTAEKAQKLAAEAGATFLAMDALAFQDFDVLIHATPAGMLGNEVALPIAQEHLRARLVFDLVYNPAETPLLAMARTMGCSVIPGVEMFVHQGARQFEIWTGGRAPVELMQEAVLGALRTAGPAFPEGRASLPFPASAG